MEQLRDKPALWFHPGKIVQDFRIEQTDKIVFGKSPSQGHAFVYCDGDKNERRLGLIFSGEGRSEFKSQRPHLFRKVGEGIYRAQDDVQLVVSIGDGPWKTIGGDMFGINAQFLKEGFTGWLSLLWLHPNQAERIVHLGHDSEAVQKVVYQGPYTSSSTTKPHGAWSFHPRIENYPSAVEPGSLVLVVKVHFRGEEEQALETLFGRVRGTTNVFTAIGTNVPAVGVRIYQDEEITAMRDFHIHAIVLGEVHDGLKAFW